MKLKFFTFFLVLIFIRNAFALSPQAKVSLLTIAPGQELYSTFGHSAFWIFDPATGVDRVYGYGTFDFETPGFYMKFTRGKLNYMLSVTDIANIMAGAEYEQRSVSAQILNLSDIQKDRLYKFLETNYLPENRFYLYDFYYDNCATRLRDALVEACGKDLNYNLTTDRNQSFRQLIDTHLKNHPFSDFGMDLGQGAPADKIATPYQYLFLPEELREAFESASLESDGKMIPLVADTKLLFQGHQEVVPDAFITPAFLLWTIFLVGLFFTVRGLKKQPVKFSWDINLLMITGLFGCLLLFLWFGTDHKVTKHNWNLIWAMPLNIMAAIMLAKKINFKFLSNYFLVYGILTIVLLLCWFILPQEFNNATIPLVLLLAVRSFYLFYKLKAQADQTINVQPNN